MKYIVKNWSNHQHYKDRSPPWIKLQTDTFQDYDFSRLQDASKLLAVCIWTLAAKSKDASVPDDIEWIKGQCCVKLFEQQHLIELIAAGFIIPKDDASKVLASCKQSACPETEGETEESRDRDREETDARDPLKTESQFQSFIAAFPARSNINDARKRFSEAITKASIETLVSKATEYRISVTGCEERFIQNPAKWLENERWGEKFPIPIAQKPRSRNLQA